MKRYGVYKDIRKRAVIMGLPLSLFAMQMVSVIGSLLIIIFSFSMAVIVSILVLNMVLYVSLSHITKQPALFHIQKVFPKTISNKKPSQLHYE